MPSGRAALRRQAKADRRPAHGGPVVLWTPTVGPGVSQTPETISGCACCLQGRALPPSAGAWRGAGGLPKG